MKKFFFTVCSFILLSSVSLHSSSFAVSLGTFDGLIPNPTILEGSHLHAGIVAGISSSLELEVFVNTSVTPLPFHEFIGGTSLNLALMGPVYGYKSSYEVPPYGNAYIGIGFIGNLTNLGSYGPVIRFTPISVGGPEFVLRERAGTLGLFYDIPSNSVTLFWNIFLLDFYL
jgi:hypothetical protein